jgi:hypothetical protein
MMDSRKLRCSFLGSVVIGITVAVGAAASVAAAANTAASSGAKAKPTTKAVASTAYGKKSHFPGGGMPESARSLYAFKWGVDQLSAKLTESSELVRFTYRVIDPTKAAPLQDHAAAPSMLDERARVALQVPTMEKVGPLRQQMSAQSGKTYWIAFSNKGFPVKTGDQVSVVIGSFRVDGLIVQ